jgi:tRNA/tmRNA/rRNA uracil-C5-methylase (TrmA/RlmC/RlmD family)
MTELTENAVLEVSVEGAVAGGRCLARHEGKVLLVAGALPGERVKIRITRDEKRHAEAEIVEILEPHPHRREPPCPHAGACGGCDFQHADRDLQLSMKRAIVLDAYRRIGRLDVEDLLEGPSPSGLEFGARNRIRLTFDPLGRPGLLRRASHEVVPIDECLLMESTFGEVALPWLRMVPPWKRVTVRLDSRQEAILLFESSGQPKDRRRLGKITRGIEPPGAVRGMLADGIPLAGQRDLHFRVLGKEFRADATSFFQVNSAATEELVRIVDELLAGDRGGLLLDLYAGVGLFAVCVGRGFDRLVASEADHRSARYLKRNLRRNGVRGQARAEKAHATLREVEREGTETLILDPPRVGLSREVRREILSRRPRRILSISCDVATGARDSAVFVKAGWRLTQLRAVDLFPVTSQVETVGLFVRD